MNLINLIVGGLATWRLAHALVKENGPLMSFARLRARLATAQKRSGGLFDMFSCVYCLSLWIGLVGALFTSESIIQWLAHGFAFSAIATLIEMQIKES